MPKVLVLDCWMRKGLSVVRGLGHEGLIVDCCGHKSVNPVRFSKFVNRFFIIPNPSTHPGQFKNALLSIIKNGVYDCVMPLEEETIDVLLPIRKEIEKFARIPMPSEDKYNLAVDKWHSVSLAKKLNIPSPKSFCPQNSEDVRNALSNLSFPIIIKPRRTSGGRGLKKVNNMSEFNTYYPNIVKNFGRPLLQEYIGEGSGVLAWFIVNKNNIMAEFSYKRLRKYPINSGPGTMWVSTDDEKVKEYTLRIAKALRWEGIIIGEFKVDTKDNTPKFMEINPRMGGSSAHPMFCGVNFPYILYLFSQGKIISAPQYVKGRYTRWLVADVLHFLSNKNRWQMSPNFFKFFNSNTFYEEFDRKDMSGNIGIIFNYLLNLFDFEIIKKGIFRK